MKTTLYLLVALVILSAARYSAFSDLHQGRKAAGGVRFITLDPGHFHAGLVQKEMYPGVSHTVNVYAPLGSDLLDHLNRIMAFNIRGENPTSWKLEVHTGPDFLERMLREKPGNVVVLSGKNLGKIDRIKASVDARLNVLADKPWIIDEADFPKLESVLETADQEGLAAYDIMTERYEITGLLQRELVNDRDVFGTPVSGTAEDPAVRIESVHQLLKLVAGVPLRRPAWFFDTQQQGEGLADVGTHLVDNAQWTLFPDQGIDYRKDVNVLAAKRWPTVLTRADFQKITGDTDFPSYLRANLRGDTLDYFCNTQVSYALRGINVKLDVLWNCETTPAADTLCDYYRGSRSRIEIRQTKDAASRPELYVVPDPVAKKDEVEIALRKRIDALQAAHPGLVVQDLGKEFRIDIPEGLRVGHEAHFAQVTTRFLGFLKDPKTIPAWERSNMLAKYYVTTRGVALSRR